LSEPELDQILSKDKWYTYNTPDWFIALLSYLGDEIWRVTHNLEIEGHRGDGIFGINPSENYGEDFINNTFEMRAYTWTDCICGDLCILSIPINPIRINKRLCLTECISCIPNFRYKNFEVRWYKYLGRATIMNKDITPEEGVEIFNTCLKSLWDME